MIIGAPASSRRRTVSRSSTRGDAPGIKRVRQLKSHVCRGKIHRSSSYAEASPFSAAGSLRRDSGNGDMRQLLVESDALCGLFLGRARQLSKPRRVDLRDHAEACLVPAVLFDRVSARGCVDHQRGLTALDASGIEAIQGPDAGIHREFLLVGPKPQIIAVGDAVAVGDDERGPIEALGFPDGLHRVGVLGAEGDGSDVDVAIAHRHQAQVFLVDSLARGGELGGGAQRRALGCLAPGVGINLRIQHQDVDLVAHRQDVIQAAETDVVRPAIAADEPDGLLNQVVGQLLQPIARRENRSAPSFSRSDDDAPALGTDSGFRGLVGIEDFLDQSVADVRGQRCEQLLGLAFQVVDAQPQPETKLGVVFKERVRPGGPAAAAVDGVGSGGQVAAVDRRAAGRVGDQEAIAEELREQLDVGRLPAAGAGSRVFEERQEELRTLDVDVADTVARRIGNAQEEVVIVFLFASSTGASGAI